MMISCRGRTLPYPKDGRLKLYFDSASEGEPRRVMQAFHVYTQLLQGIGLEMEYRGHKVRGEASGEHGEAKKRGSETTGWHVQ